ncbi:hypothetical protein P5P86_03225 [Nocardioides sp. BP30]|uniref:hypothetical protein n=1 Tax=Nocardioides sp. BP30 TaxID=3036374 RepID=UPI0024683701|nr:hypothetical protein [Nocardioides sp. BP30]WGL52840.1 hypothetical protein P5P86_03225 [Nocardioides sp. BP30]
MERASAAPLAEVKTWVLRTSAAIDWRTFSSSLAEAPPNERVGVCVLTRSDGTDFDLDDGAEPVPSVVMIVRPNGQSTIFELGSLASNLATTPTDFATFR